MQMLGLALPLVAALAAIGAPAQSQGQTRPPVASYSSLAEEEKADIYILGTPHLAGLDGASPALVETTLDRLERIAPAAIGVERITAAEIELMRSSPLYADGSSSSPESF